MNNATAVEIIEAYTANLVAAEPNASADYINLTVAAVFANYLAAAVDPGKYAYYPHPYTEAETILHNAAAHLFAAAAEAEAVTNPVAVYEVPEEARADFAKFSAFLDSIAN